MPTTDITAPDLAAVAEAYPSDSPVFMLNLLRFHEQARYPGDVDVEPITGQEAYLGRYPPAFRKAVAPLGGAELIFGGAVLARVIGPSDEQWDAVAVVRYPSIEIFRQLITDPAYLADAEPHRRAALADWRLYATTSFG